MNLDAAGQRWVAQLASYNFSLEYQKGKDNMVADFLSRLDEPLPKEEFKIIWIRFPIWGSKLYWTMPSPLLRSGLNWESAQSRRRECQSREAVAARAAKLASTNIIDGSRTEG